MVTLLSFYIDAFPPIIIGGISSYINIKMHLLEICTVLYLVHWYIAKCTSSWTASAQQEPHSTRCQRPSESLEKTSEKKLKIIYINTQHGGVSAGYRPLLLTYSVRIMSIVPRHLPFVAQQLAFAPRLLALVVLQIIFIKWLLVIATELLAFVPILLIIDTWLLKIVFWLFTVVTGLLAIVARLLEYATQLFIFST